MNRDTIPHYHPYYPIEHRHSGSRLPHNFFANLVLVDPRNTQMAPEIKFNAFGIPYIVEFKNISFRARSRSRSRTPPRRTTIVDRDSRCFSFIVVDRPPSFDDVVTDTASIASIATASSQTLAYPGEDTGEGEGLFIQFATHCGMHQKLSAMQLWRLKQRIATAVIAAGMDASPGTEKTDPMPAIPTLSRISYGSIRSDGSAPAPDDSPGALFRGTYGQVMTALQAAGLIVTPCKESGFDQGAHLEALGTRVLL